MSKTVLDTSAVWTSALSLKEGDTATIEYRKTGNKTWVVGIFDVLRAGNPHPSTADEAYVHVRMQGLTPRGVPHDVVFFPQDGRLGTAQVEYASVSVHERNDLTPYANSLVNPAGLPASPRRRRPPKADARK
eukprot:PhM_4_TR14270/c2_g4_i3/m.4937